jgi:hypothetical protein
VRTKTREPAKPTAHSSPNSTSTTDPRERSSITPRWLDHRTESGSLPPAGRRRPRAGRRRPVRLAREQLLPGSDPAANCLYATGYTTPVSHTRRVTGQPSGVPTEDEVALRLSALRDRMRSAYGDGIRVVTHQLGGPGIVRTDIAPARPEALGITWTEMGDREVIIEAGRGGRWELPRETQTAEFLERLADAAAHGRATEVYGRTGVRFTAEFAVGKMARSGVSGAGVPRQSVWRRAERRHYAPWQ